MQSPVSPRDCQWVLIRIQKVLVIKVTGMCSQCQWMRRITALVWADIPSVGLTLFTVVTHTYIWRDTGGKLLTEWIGQSWKQKQLDRKQRNCIFSANIVCFWEEMFPCVDRHCQKTHLEGMMYCFALDISWVSRPEIQPVTKFAFEMSCKTSWGSQL